MDRREATAVQKAMHRTRTLFSLYCVLDDQSKPSRNLLARTHALFPKVSPLKMPNQLVQIPR